jgi:hypothetical protein
MGKGSEFVGAIFFKPVLRIPRSSNRLAGFGAVLPIPLPGVSPASAHVSNLLIKVNMLSSNFNPRCHNPRGTSDWDFWYWAFCRRTGSKAVDLIISCLITGV